MKRSIDRSVGSYFTVYYIYIDVRTHFNVYREDVARGVSGVARQRLDLARHPDCPVAEGKGQREEAGDDEDDSDDVLDS